MRFRYSKFETRHAASFRFLEKRLVEKRKGFSFNRAFLETEFCILWARNLRQ